MAGMIPQSVLEEVQRRLNPIDIIGRYVSLRRRGSKYLGLCPFHKEKTPSMNVDPDNGLWYCFGCHEGGNVFQFVMRMEGLKYYEAVRQLAQEVGITVELSDTARQENNERQRALNLLDRAADFYHSVLLESPQGEVGREYMIKRNISRDTAVKFRLGWAPDGNGALLQTLHKAGFTTEEASKCGLLTYSEFYGTGDLMRNRLIFPICDPQGKVLAFGGRSLGDSKAKYMNTPETPWYSKRHNLYGLSQAKSSIKSQDVSLLVEGYFDVISLHQVGITTAVASCGTALTAEQAQVLKRFSGNVLLLYDSDLAGQKATLSANAVLEEAGLRAQVVRLPDGEDPDSLAQSGVDAVSAVLSRAEGVVPYLMGKLAEEIDLTTPEGKEDYVRQVMPLLRKVKDPTRRDAYVRKLAYYSGATEAHLHRGLRGYGVIPEHREQRVRAFNNEEKLFCLCLNNPQWVEAVRGLVSADMIEDEKLRPFFQAIFAFPDLEQRKQPLTLNELMDDISDDDLLSHLAELLTRDSLASTKEDVLKLASVVRDKRLRVRLEKLRREVISALDKGEMQLDDPRYLEYCELKRHFHG